MLRINTDSLSMDLEQPRKQLRSSNVNGHPVGEPRVRGLFNNAYALSMGFVNASLGSTTTQAGICTSNITRIVQHSQDFRNYIRDGTPEAYNQSAVSFENVLGSIHPITYSCFMAFNDLSTSEGGYAGTITDFRKLSYNMIHEMGKIYDTFYYMQKHQQKYGEVKEGTAFEITDWWFKTGIYYGTVTYLIFYTPDEVSPFDPINEYYPSLDNSDNQPVEEPVEQPADDKSEIIPE